VKLLFDANLSPTLVVHLQAEYPDSAHVRDVGLRAGSDAQIWEYAKAHGLAIVSKDTDFRERSFVEGFPPKVIWLDAGNAGTEHIAALIQKERARVEAFGKAAETSLLILSLGASAV
jgi:predicted nuclease of predicted toxin-antitoxin system